MLGGKDRSSLMALEWIECTSRHDNEIKMQINMALATCVFLEGKGARICFAGDNENYSDVAETPDQILLKLKAVQDGPAGLKVRKRPADG
jgi:hypothetical protein